MADFLPVFKDQLDFFTDKEIKNGLDVSKIELSTIYQFIDRGDRADAPRPVLLYLDYLEKIRRMNNRVDDYGSRNLIIKHLIKVDGLSRHLASRIYDDSMEYFFSERNISKDAYRNMLAEKMIKNINLATISAKSATEILAINKSIVEVAKVLKLDEPDPIVLDESAPLPWIIFTTDAKQLGLPEMDRTAVSAGIDAIPDISEKVREHVKREAEILPMILFPTPEKDGRKD